MLDYISDLQPDVSSFNPSSTPREEKLIQFHILVVVHFTSLSVARLYSAQL
jgi:nitrate reductase NapE component